MNRERVIRRMVRHDLKHKTAPRRRKRIPFSILMRVITRMREKKISWKKYSWIT